MIEPMAKLRACDLPDTFYLCPLDLSCISSLPYSIKWFSTRPILACPTWTTELPR